jgi:hypothetical protein
MLYSNLFMASLRHNASHSQNAKRRFCTISVSFSAIDSTSWFQLRTRLNRRASRSSSRGREGDYAYSVSIRRWNPSLRQIISVQWRPIEPWWLLYGLHTR